MSKWLNGIKFFFAIVLSRKFDLFVSVLSLLFKKNIKNLRETKKLNNDTLNVCAILRTLIVISCEEYKLTRNQEANRSCAAAAALKWHRGFCFYKTSLNLTCSFTNRSELFDHLRVMRFKVDSQFWFRGYWYFAFCVN